MHEPRDGSRKRMRDTSLIKIKLHLLYLVMERTISISEDVYEELVKIKKTKGFSEALMEMMKKEGNLNTLQIGFGSSG